MAARRKRRRPHGAWTILPVTGVIAASVSLAALARLPVPPAMRIDMFWVNMHRRVVTVWVIAIVTLTLVSLLALIMRRHAWLLGLVWLTTLIVGLVFFSDQLRVIIPVVVDRSM